MRRIAVVLVAAVSACGGQAASAADLAVKAPVYKAVPMAVWSWTGFYIGGNVGYSWGNSDSTETITNGVGATLFTNSGSFKLNGPIGGGQIGYNWQSDNWVYGVEGDIQASGQKGGVDFVCPTDVCSPGVAVVGSLNEKLTWFGTLRLRAGVLVTPSTLAYVTGGWAFGGIKSDLMLSIPGTTNTFSSSTSRNGWTLGLGVETNVGGNWTAKLEYIYLNLGTFSNAYATAIPAPVRGGFLGVNYSSRITDNIVRIGLNYKFP
jgi:outer membrane immunogenic protein